MRSPRIPKGSLGIPRDALGIPKDSLGILLDSLWVPKDFLRIPKDSQGAPKDSQSLPLAVRPSQASIVGCPPSANSGTPPAARPAKNNLRCAPPLIQIHNPCSSSRTAHARNNILKLLFFFGNSKVTLGFQAPGRPQKNNIACSLVSEHIEILGKFDGNPRISQKTKEEVANR